MKNKILSFLDSQIYLKKRSFTPFILLLCLSFVTTFSFTASAVNETQTQQTKKTVSGVITDAAGEPLVGVTVREQGTTNGVITNADGKYSIEVNNGAVLNFTYVGYKSATQAVGSGNTLNVSLVEDVATLDELVVVGYGVQKKSDVTGALTQVSEKTIKERPVQNAIQAMQGKAAGVDIQTNARPGEISNVVIRGTRSINASNSPLYVVDGVILMGDMNDINPNDIASMEILKDASSTAIYGSRGANGVVLITTKSGKKDVMAVDYNSTLSFDRINSLTEWASAGEMLDRMRLADINGSTYKSGSTSLSYPDPFADILTFGNGDAATINAIRSAYEWNDPGTYASVKTRAATAGEKALGYPDMVPVYDSSRIPTTDWRDMLTRTGLTQSHQISISAGTDKSRIYTSIGYYGNKGAQLNQGYNRYTFRLNGDINPLSWLNFGASVNTSYSEQQYGRINRSGSATGANDSYGMALGQYLMSQPYDENGNLIEYPGNNAAAPVWNPFIDIENTNDLTRRVNIQANTYVGIKFAPWISYRMNFGTGYRTDRSGTFQGSKSTLRRKTNGAGSAATYSNSDNFQYLIENILYLNKKFGIHDLGATLMQSAQYSRTESSFIEASKILYDTSKWYNLGANLNGKPDNYGSGYSENSILSYMGRINYNLLDRYLVTASLRYDGASVLAKGHKYDFFPSFAVAWKIQEESFIKSVKWIDEMKLRFGYGVTGNASVSPYTTSGPLVRYNYVFGTTPAIGMLPYSMPNPNLGWEKTAQYNLGLDFGFLNRRIFGTIETYISDTYDIIMSRNIPPITGYPNINDNIGRMRNKGFEFTLTTRNIISKNFSWTTDFNLATNKEEIVELVNGKVDMKGNGWFIGYPLQVFRTYKVDGLWQNTPEDLAEIAKWKANNYNFQPGQYRVVEQGTPDYKLTDNDKVIVGSNRPKVILGLTNSLAYKNWELSFFLYARLGQSYFSSLIPGGSKGGTFVGNGRKADLSEFWSPDNTEAKYPQLTSATTNDDVTRATYINDGSFVAVRNISLAYNFSDQLIKKIYLKNLQLFGQVLNPFMFGGEVVKAGINPDDATGWTSTNSIGDPVGGTNNNTIMMTDFVVGIRASL
ncbi:MAG: SusC/RagA family TonB-linked outer membrane protein [Paludibacteraceae bacterium]